VETEPEAKHDELISAQEWASFHGQELNEQQDTVDRLESCIEHLESTEPSGLLGRGCALGWLVLLFWSDETDSQKLSR
jgi:hypothetical protein